ncbi:MAG TPA: anti-sigma factor [Acidobacteriaceae bacterium]|jgi:anti-sigma-K factor RskA
MNRPGSNPAPIPAEDLALYAMQALPAQEMAAIAAALRDNPQGQQELARIQGDLALVALSADQQPAPAGAFERLQQRMRETAPAGPASVPSEGPIEMTATQAEITAAPSARRSKWATFTPWVIAAALAIACAILGYRTASLNDALDGESGLVSNLAAKASHAQQVLEVLNAPNAQRVTLTATKTPAEPTAHTVYLADRGALVMEANNLKPVPAGKTYELWVIPASDAAPVPAGTFQPNGEGYASLVLPTLPSGIAAKAFGITIENAGGSAKPTLPIILSGE